MLNDCILHDELINGFYYLILQLNTKKTSRIFYNVFRLNCFVNIVILSKRIKYLFKKCNEQTTYDTIKKK